LNGYPIPPMHIEHCFQVSNFYIEETVQSSVIKYLSKSRSTLKCFTFYASKSKLRPAEKEKIALHHEKMKFYNNKTELIYKLKSINI